MQKKVPVELDNAIRSEFLSSLRDSDTDNFEALIAGARALAKLEGCTLPEACRKLTHWAVEDGFIPESAEEEAEQQAEEIVGSSAA